MTTNTTPLATVRQFCTNHPAFTEGGMRWMIFHQESNGYAGCFPKVGRKRLVDVGEFFSRISKLNEG